MAIRSLKTGSFSRSTQVGNSIILPGDYESIATTTLSTATSTITFSSIPQTFTHLQIRGLARSDRSATDDGLYFRLNGVTTSSYVFHRLSGDGSAASSSWSGGAGTYGILGKIPAASATTSIFGNTVIDILEYKNTNINKTLRSLSGNDRNGSGTVDFYSNLFINTNAITSITIGAESGNLTQYSSFALYGIRG